jgi:serine/threonine-protein kinase
MEAGHTPAHAGDPPLPDPFVGQMLGQYRVVRKLGEGGMGVVYEGVREAISQRVAIKLLHGRMTRDGKTFQRFHNEARAISIVQHPGMVKIHDYQQTPDGMAYIVMEFLEGQSLADRLDQMKGRVKGDVKQGRLPAEEALDLGRQIASALAAAHGHGIIHCDLKPDNIFLVSDPLLRFGQRVKILDFGIAKFVLDSGGRKTTEGLILGTPRYMAPEQCEGRDSLSDRVDVYALGVILYELLAGAPPFEAASSAALMRQHMVKPPPPLTERVRGLPPQVVDLVERMLAKDPTQRPAMAEVFARLDGAAPQRGRARAIRIGRLWPVALAAAALSGAGLLWHLRRPAPSPPPVAARPTPPVPAPQPAPVVPAPPPAEPPPAPALITEAATPRGAGRQRRKGEARKAAQNPAEPAAAPAALPAAPAPEPPRAAPPPTAPPPETPPAERPPQKKRYDSFR